MSRAAQPRHEFLPWTSHPIKNVTSYHELHVLSRRSRDINLKRTQTAKPSYKVGFRWFFCWFFFQSCFFWRDVVSDSLAQRHGMRWRFSVSDICYIFIARIVSAQLRNPYTSYTTQRFGGAQSKFVGHIKLGKIANEIIFTCINSQSGEICTYGIIHLQQLHQINYCVFLVVTIHVMHWFMGKDRQSFVSARYNVCSMNTRIWLNGALWSLSLILNVFIIIIKQAE